MDYVDGMRELVGNTPMVKLNQLSINKKVNLFAKLELYNPAGSVKDRIGVAMIEDAEKTGKLRPGDTIIEATAGNTGLGVAFAALNKDYNVVFVVPDKFSEEKQVLMRALGATIVNTPKEEGMTGAKRKMQELLENDSRAVSLGQFENPVNPEIHYKTTGPEIYRALEGKIDYFIAGAGSGGTFSGVMKYFKEQNPNIKGILADPVGSTMGGGEHAYYDIEGIGNDFIADTMDMSLVDDIIKVTDEGAKEECRLLARQEGIIAGSSSGAALYAAKILIDRIDGGNVVTVFPDRGDRYFSKQLFV